MGDVSAQGAYVTVEPPYRVTFSWDIPGNDALPPGASTVEVVLTHRGVPSNHLDTHRSG